METPIKTEEVPLNEATRQLIASIESDNHKARAWGVVAVLLGLLILSVGVIGIYQQNSLSKHSRDHLDCIVKLFSTPIPKDKKTRFISDPNNTCGIKFSN